MEDEEKIEILSQPLTTEDGFINPACINELESAILNMPKIHERSADDNEWTEKRFIVKKDITSNFARWAIHQSPYQWPEGLETVVKYLDACLEKSVEWKPFLPSNGYAYLSLNDISNLLYSILYEQNFAAFDAWNVSKNRSDEKIRFTSAFSAPGDPDDEFIGLDALLTNVSVAIRNERRKADEFDRKFNEEWELNHPEDKNNENY